MEVFANPGGIIVDAVGRVYSTVVVKVVGGVPIPQRQFCGDGVIVGQLL